VSDPTQSEAGDSAERATIVEMVADQPSSAQSPSSDAGEPDDLFLDDLSATRRFMSFLASRGLATPNEIREQLGKLASKFRDEIERYEERVKHLVENK
jgi:hypothetical protein